MRKALLLLLFSLFIIEANGQDFGGGIVAGLTTSQVSGDELSGFDKAGLCFGILTDRNLNDKWAIQLEMLYMDKGSRTKTSDSTRVYILHLGYLETPLIFRYRIRKLELEFGPSFAVLISHSETINGFDREAPKKFYPTELSYNVGLTYSLLERLKMDLRWTDSITAIRDHESGGKTFWNRGQYNTLLSFSLRYYFPLKQKHE